MWLSARPSPPSSPSTTTTSRPIASAAALVIDQAHKAWMLGIHRIQDQGRVAILPFLDLVFVKNTGISYSLLDQSSYVWQLPLAAVALAASPPLLGSPFRARP